MDNVLDREWKPGEYIPWMLEHMKGTPEQKELLESVHQFTDAFTKQVDDEILMGEGGFIKYEETLKGGGTSTKLGTVTLLSMYSGGRIMLTFSEGDDQVSFVYAHKERPSRIGLQSTEGSYLRAQEIINTACANWDVSLVKEDNEVWFG